MWENECYPPEPVEWRISAVSKSPRAYPPLPPATTSTCTFRNTFMLACSMLMIHERIQSKYVRLFVDDALTVVPSGPRMKPHPWPCRAVLRDGMASTNPDMSYLKKNMKKKSESKDMK